MTKLIYILALIAIFAGCTSRHYDPRLEEINNLASEDAGQAIARLDSIDVTALSSSDRNYYDFLTIKTRDKAFITHTADSLIKEVLDYTASNDKNLYPEALYYGGRVYSDLGDYPTALSYYQQSLDLLEDDNANLKLKGNVLSQMGSLLREIRLYEESSVYASEAIKVDSILSDTLNLIYDLELLGSNYFKSHNYGAAERLFLKAKDLSVSLSSPQQFTIDVYLAAIKYHLRLYNQAIEYVKGVENKVSQNEYNWALAYTTDIYLLANKPDSAYKYANKLKESKYPNFKKSAYKALISPNLRHLVPTDSLLKYASDYATVLNSELYKEGIDETESQESYYNYKIQQRQRIKVEKRYNNLIIWTVLIALCCLIQSVFIFKYRKNRKLNEQRNYIDLAESDTEPNLFEKRLELRQNLLSISESQSNNKTLSKTNENVEANEFVKSYLDNDKRINNTFWEQLEKIVLLSSPKFKSDLFILTKGAISDAEFKTAMLIKCGITPTQMKKIFSITASSVTSRRKSLCVKIFDDNKGVELMDTVIRCL